MHWSQKLAWTFLALLAPFMLAWTSWSFWRLATVGRMYVRQDGGIVDADGGLQLWVTLGLYVVLWFGSITMLVASYVWLRGKLGRRSRP